MSLPHVSQRIRKALTSPWRPLIRGGRSAREPGYLLLGMSSFLQKMDTSHQSPSCHLSKQHPGLCWLRMAPEHCCRMALRGQIRRKSLHGPSGGGQPPQPGVPCPQKGSRSWPGGLQPYLNKKTGLALRQIFPPGWKCPRVPLLGLCWNCEASLCCLKDDS